MGAGASSVSLGQFQSLRKVFDARSKSPLHFTNGELLDFLRQKYDVLQESAGDEVEASVPSSPSKPRKLAYLITAFDEWEMRGYGNLELSIREADVLITFFTDTATGMRASNLDKCIEYLKKVQRIRENVAHYPARVEEHDNIYTIAKLCLKENKYDKALHYFVKCLNLRLLRYSGEDSATVATTLNDIGIVYNLKAKHQKGFTYDGDQLWKKASVAALENFEQALEVRTRLFGQRHIAVANVLVGIAAAHYLLGNYTRALQRYELCLAIRELVLGKDNKHTVAAQTKVADVYFAIGTGLYDGKKPDLEGALGAFDTCTTMRTELIGAMALPTQQARTMMAEVKNCQIKLRDEDAARRGTLFGSDSTPTL